MGALSQFERRKLRVRRQLRKVSSGRPRLSVHRSSKNIYAQVIDDVTGRTVAAASTLEKELKSSLKTGADKTAAEVVGKTVAEVERDLIIDTLKHCLCNRTHAANILGISIRTLRNKLNQYQTDGISVPQPDSQ